MSFLELKQQLVSLLGWEEYQVHNFLVDYFECADRYSYPQNIEQQDVNKIRGMIPQLQAGVPKEYVLHKAFFWQYYFYVDQRVLIPRFDTEISIEQSLPYAENAYILDLCTGSGMIGITLLKNTNHSHIILADISQEALDVATYNVQHLCTSSEQERVRLVKSDLFQNITGTFDLIVSNPPYIPTKDVQSLDTSVQYEPHLALDGGVDGLDCYRAIIEKAPYYLHKDGVLVLEVGIDQAKDVTKYLEKDFKYITIIKDNHGIERTIRAVKK